MTWEQWSETVAAAVSDPRQAGGVTLARLLRDHAEVILRQVRLLAPQPGRATVEVRAWTANTA